MVQQAGCGLVAASPAVSWDPQVQEYFEAAVGVEQFTAMQAALAVPPLHTCVRVNTLQSTPQEVKGQLHQLLSGTQASTAAAEGQAGSTTDSPGPDCKYSISSPSQIPVALLLEGSGPHPVDLSNVSKQVLVSRKAGEAVLRGAQLFVPGVLGCSAGVSAGDTVAVMIDLSGPNSTATRGMVLPSIGHTPAGSSTQNGEAAQQPLQQQQQQWLCAGIGRACVGRAEMFRLQHGVAVELTQRVYDVPSLNGQLQGSVMLQNLPSIVAAHVLNPPSGSRVLDMCAAPGGKTTMLAQIMGCVGQVYALDRSHAKVDDIKALAAELGCSSCITAIKMDATKAVAAPGVVPEGQQQQKQQQQVPAFQQQQQQRTQQEQQQQEHSLPEAAGAAGGRSQVTDQRHQGQDLHQPESCQQTQPALQHLQQQQQQQQPTQQQQQQQQQQGGMPQGMSAKAQQRLTRRLASMAARGHAPSAKEFRLHGPAPAVPKCPGFAPESFSHVLLDAPCTALGVRPKLQQPLTLQQLMEAAAYQRQLLATAVRLVAPGGYLVYSTCSISPAENEINVWQALDTYPCLQLVPAQPFVGGPGLKGPADAAKFAAVLERAAASCGDKPNPSVTVALREAAAVLEGAGCWLTEEQAGMVQRFTPGGVHDTIGFFVAKFQKTGSC